MLLGRLTGIGAIGNSWENGERGGEAISNSSSSWVSFF